MHRVNLLGARENALSSSATGEGSEKRGAVIALGLLGLSLTSIGYMWFSAERTLREMSESINQLEQEKARLGPIIIQVEEFMEQLEQLKEKERLIERLKREREGPVRILDALSVELPDLVWLTELRQTEGSVTIDGMAASYVSIADYIGKLDDNDWFRDVELIDARVSSSSVQEFTEFQLRAEVVTPDTGENDTPSTVVDPAGGLGGGQ